MVVTSFPYQSNPVGPPCQIIELCTTGLNQLGKRLKKGTGFKNDYVEFMDQLIANYAEKVPAILDAKSKPMNCIPHSGDYHPKKPSK